MKERITKIKDELGYQFRYYSAKIGRVYHENREFIIVATPVVGSLILGVLRHTTKQKVQHLKDDYIYDRRYGHYWKLRKSPTTNEWLEIERRKNEGEDLGSILRDMRLV